MSQVPDILNCFCCLDTKKNLQQEVANKVKRVTCQAMSKIATIN